LAEVKNCFTLADVRLSLLAIYFCIPITLCHCGQDYNSDSSDAAFANLNLDCSGTSGQQLCAAVIVFMSNKCFTCHSSWTSYNTDNAWIQAGLVTAGNATGSLLITKLSNSGGDMPKNLPPISATDYATLQTWIGNM
jgi:hypothetical protein